MEAPSLGQPDADRDGNQLWVISRKAWLDILPLVAFSQSAAVEITSLARNAVSPLPTWPVKPCR